MFNFAKTLNRWSGFDQFSHVIEQIFLIAYVVENCSLYFEINLRSETDFEKFHIGTIASNGQQIKKYF